MSEYSLTSFKGTVYTGQGDTLRAAIADTLAQLAAAELHTLSYAKLWCLQYLRLEATRRKGDIFSAAGNYDPVELMEMLAEARDYRISGNTTAARYPLAAGLATARGVTPVSVLTAWSNAFADAFARLATLVHRQEQAETAIQGAATMAALGEVMTTILEQLA